MNSLHSTAGRGWPRWTLILICAAAVAMPLAIRGASCGHDFDFHLQSWLAVARQWRHGIFYPSWVEGANYGAGEPRLVFYPPISWMLGALCGLLLPWNAAPIAFTFVVMAGYGFSMYALARDWMSPHPATLAACAYVLNPYALFVAYERTAYGELVAGIWLPLIVLYGLRRTGTVPPGRDAASPGSKQTLSGSGKQTAAGPEDLHRRPVRSTVTNILLLALSLAAVWLSNAPAAVMSCYFLAAIAAWAAVSRHQLQPLLQAAGGLLLGLGLASFYLVPASYERRWVDITRALGPGTRFQDGFFSSYTGIPFHDALLRKITTIFATMLATIFLTAAIAWVRGASGRILLPLFLAAAVLLALQLPFTTPIWAHIPELEFLQFPWRWTMVLSIVFALSLGLAATPRQLVTRRTFPLQAAIILLTAVGIVYKANRLFQQYCDEEDIASAQVALFHSGHGFEGTDEYSPLGADNSMVPQDLPQVRILRDPEAETISVPGNGDEANPAYVPDPGETIPATITIRQWQAEQKSLTVTARSPGFAVLRLMDYPAWRVSRNGASVSRGHRDDGLMTIPIPAGESHLEIAYTATTDLWWGRTMTAASILTVLALAAGRRKPHPSQLS